MEYDIIGGDTLGSDTEFYTIQMLVDLAVQHPDKEFIFLGTDYAPKSLSSWRGSYSLPAITYTLGTVNGDMLSNNLLDGLERTHEGYKGGDYKYESYEEFYVSQEHNTDMYKVVGYEVTGNTVTLLTKIDEY